MIDREPVPYAVLTRIADDILEAGEDNPAALAGILDRLEPGIREELFTSDLLNALQVFFFYFREDPGDLETDRLMLQPASALSTGVVFADREFFELVFLVEAGIPVITVSDGELVRARFSGPDAYRLAVTALDEMV
jgi:hypothetical protein